MARNGMSTSHRTQLGRGSLLLFGTLLSLWHSVYGLDAALDVDQYAHTAWRLQEGFLRGAIKAIAQTPDGYLWLGTDFALFRFDGVRAVQWHPPEGKILPDC